MKYEDEMMILDQNDVFCGHNVVNFSVCFLQLTVFKYLVASHETEPGSLLTEPGAVIKFSRFSSHLGIMYAKKICWENTHIIMEGAQKFAVLTPHDVRLHKDKKTLLLLRINIVASCGDVPRKRSMHYLANYCFAGTWNVAHNTANFDYINNVLMAQRGKKFNER